MNKLPRVIILMATYNGLKYLPEQIESLLNQINVDIKIIINDDFSTDGTWEYLNDLKNNKIEVVSQKKWFRSASGNFFHLLTESRLDDADFVGLCDQDDIWNSNKLDSQIKELITKNIDGCSSDVTAFWGDIQKPSRIKYVCKSQAVGKWNHMFESAGPGCTFLFKKNVIIEIIKLLKMNQTRLTKVASHDWLLFSLIISQKFKWSILPQSTLMYRQHSNNVIGANSGWKSSIKRIQLLMKGWYRNEILAIAKICENENIKPIVQLHRLGLKDLIFLVTNLKHMRRKKFDQLVLGFYFFYLFFMSL